MSLNAESIFHEARVMPADMRVGYLKGACGTDVALRAKVEALLKAHVEAESFLETVEPAVGGHNGHGSEKTTEPPPAPMERPGQTFGRFKLLQPIGEGGFGTVWMAEQKEPVKRRVALKIIKLGMDTKQVVARFEAERQALAMMDHPNIAKVLDAGATDTGRPYFVMEYIKGVPILEYCDTEKLDTEARLKLFIQVCNAIQHAHQKGIIHRDLKPSNVLVTLHDGVPVPKVIDFGVAKATNTELTQKTLFTEHRHMIGTPAYMSPEQAEMSGLDIDTRSDIYSLGVVLYELLTGTTPFDSKSLREAGYAGMLRIIREQEPHKPSTRLSTLGEHATRTAQQRKADVKKLGTMLRGDLDWIVMKCLEKDRSRRYETANGLAADIRRHLENEPVTASPPNPAYRLKKLIRRNKGIFAAAAAVFLVLAVGVIGTTWGLVAARSQALRAETELARGDAVTDLINEMFKSANPHENKGADFTVRQLLDEFRPSLNNQFDDQPLVEASIREIVAWAYQGLGLTDDAELHLQRALELKQENLDPDHADLLQTRLSMLSILHDRGQYEEGLEVGYQLLDAIPDRPDMESWRLWTKELLGDLNRHMGRYDQAEPLLLEVLELRRQTEGSEHRETLGTMAVLATVYENQRRYDEAEALHEETLEIKKRVLGPEHPDTLGTMSNLASVWTEQDRYAEAEALLETVLDIQKRVLGPEHPDTLRSTGSLAAMSGRLGRDAEAEARFHAALEIMERVLGAEHPVTLKNRADLAHLYQVQQRFNESEELYKKTLEIQQRVHGTEHPDTLDTTHSLAVMYRNQGRYAVAESLFKETLKVRQRVLGPEHAETLETMNSLALLYDNQRLYAEAESLYEQSLEIMRRDRPDDPKTLATMYNLANLYLDQDRYAEAEPLHKEALEISKRVLGPEHPATLDSMNQLALVYKNTGRYEEAASIFLDLIPIRKRVQGMEHRYTLGAITNLGLTYNLMEQYEDAVRMFEQSLPVMRDELALDDPFIRTALRGLGRAYEALGRRDESSGLHAEYTALQAIAAADDEAADAYILNDAAWALLTLEHEAQRDAVRALDYAERACGLEEAAGGENLYRILDTLARAQFENDDIATAIETQKRAVELIPNETDEDVVRALHEALQRYEDARADGAE